MNAREHEIDVAARLAPVDWGRVATDLDTEGSALVERLLVAAECAALRALYAQEQPLSKPGRDGSARLRSRRVQILRLSAAGSRRCIAHCAVRAARTGRQSLERSAAHRRAFSGAARRLHRALPFRAGQTRPTPLLLQCGTDDYNCLHQDLYGAHVFPLQAVILLSDPARDFDGGEFVLTEQRPRMQSRPVVLPLCQGDVAMIAVHQRPVQGARGVYCVNMRHGVSRVRSGHRHTASIIFHDAA